MKVLILSFDFMGFADSFDNAFKNRGCDVRTLIAHIEPRDSEVLKKIVCKLGFRKKYIEKSKKNFNARVLKEFGDFSPDMVFVINGDFLFSETISRMSKSSVTVLRMLDLFKNCKNTISQLQFYNYIYTYQKNDLDICKEINANSFFLPAEYDSDQFYPLDIERDIDISFVGSTSPERRFIIEQLIQDFPDLKIVAYGKLYPLSEPRLYFKRLFSKLRKIVVNHNIGYKEVNALYNRSKIVLNIATKANQSGWSSRLLEIAASQTFQIASYEEFSKNVFKETIEYYCDYKDLTAKISQFLNNEDEREKKAKQSSCIARSFTVEKTVDKLLRTPM